MENLAQEKSESPSIEGQQDYTKTDFNTVFRKELEKIFPGQNITGGDVGPCPPRPLMGLAFSGGGIRSATFNLGVLQGLADAKLLKHFDYLSTVSGGGYIGSWFSTLLHRKATAIKTPEAPASKITIALDALQSELTQPNQASSSNQPFQNAQSSIKWLRRYSSYLTPRYGLFGLDMLAAIAGLFRNLLLNQAILICLLLAVLLLPYLLMKAGHWLNDPSMEGYFVWLVVPIPIILLPISIFLIHKGLTTHENKNARSAVILAFIGAGFSSLLFYSNYHYTLPLAVLGAFLYGLTWSGSSLPHLCKEKVTGILVGVISSIALGFMLYGYGKLLGHIPPAYIGLFSLILGPVLLIQILCMTAIVHTGLAGRGFSEINREWLGRAGGQVFALEIAWVAFTSLALFSPALIDYSESWIAYSGGITWLLGSIATFWLARSEKSGSATANTFAEKWLSIAPYFVMLGLLILLSAGLQKGLVAYSGDIKEVSHVESYSGDYTITIKDNKFDRFDKTPTDARPKPNLSKSVQKILQQNAQIKFAHLGYALIIFLFIGLILARFIDVNLFSMHQFYRNRLARTYLGASNNQRNPNPFVDFDDNDDIPLAALAGQRPVHLINTTLNLTKVSNNELQWQERRGASFVFSPHYCGYQLSDSPNHQYYVPTEQYMHVASQSQKGVMLGTAVAISGAAASPNMGYNSSPPLAFLMTFFNVRLGRWCPNPANGSITSPSPKFGLWCLLRELLGSANERTDFVNLTDGGHFENLGVYELIRRKCQLIVVSDAEADSMKGFRYEGLGNVIQKCRIDFGVEIKMFGMNKIKPNDSDSRIAFGKIRYDINNDGLLIYLKPVLRGDEPHDVFHYAATHQDFPHQNTGDQWFDESQFESYRELGLITAKEMTTKLDFANTPNFTWLASDEVITSAISNCQKYLTPTHPSKAQV